MPVRQVLRDVMDLLWPEPCAVCRRPVFLTRYEASENVDASTSGPYPLCTDCICNLPTIQDPRCDLCGRELISEKNRCMRCRSRTYAFSRSVSLYAYRDSARELIHAYKFEKRFTLAGFFAANIQRIWHREFSPAPVVPVPPRRKSFNMHNGITFRRDQVERIVCALNRNHDVPVLRLLQRGAGVAQKTLDFEGRMSNLKGKFTIKDGVSIPIGKNVVLIDDVFTTGATISECARVLLSEGVKSVCAITIAID